MRKLYLLLTLPICLFLTDFGYAQNNFWTFPEQYWIPTVGPITLPGAGNTTSQYTHAGILDPYGDILFFKIDGNLYNKSGTLIQSFYTGSYPVPGSAEVLAVPQPGTWVGVLVSRVPQNLGGPAFGSSNKTLSLVSITPPPPKGMPS